VASSAPEPSQEDVSAVTRAVRGRPEGRRRGHEVGLLTGFSGVGGGFVIVPALGARPRLGMGNAASRQNL